MNRQRSAFTLMEMVFVIVVLGIIAGVAIARMGSMAQQAHIMQKLYDVNFIMKDVQNYYTLMGKFGTFDQMTDIPLSIKKNRSIYRVEGRNCVVFRVNDKQGTLSVSINSGGAGKSEICNGLADKLRAAGDVKIHEF